MKNNKQTINLIYFLSKYRNTGIVLERIKNIFNDEFKCITEQEKEIKRFTNSCNYIFSNINQSLNRELLNQSYYLLTNVTLLEKISDNIINLYYKNIDSSSHYVSAYIHLYIINNITKNNIEFAYLISNYMMYKKEKVFLMPYEYCFADYSSAISNNNLSGLIRLFYDIEIIDVNKKPDLAVSFNNNLINMEKKENIEKLKTFFGEQFNSDVDILDFTYALNTFGESEMENLITLI